MLLTFYELLNYPSPPRNNIHIGDITDHMIYLCFIHSAGEKCTRGGFIMLIVLHYYHLIAQVNMTLHLHAYHVSFSSIFSMHYSKIVYNFRPIIVAQFVIREELLLYDKNSWVQIDIYNNFK